MARGRNRTTVAWPGGAGQGGVRSGLVWHGSQRLTKRITRGVAGLGKVRLGTARHGKGVYDAFNNGATGVQIHEGMTAHEYHTSLDGVSSSMLRCHVMEGPLVCE